MKTKSLLKTFLTLLALTACLFMRPAATMAQESLPYHATVYAGTIPFEWVTSNNYGPINYNGLDYYAFSTGMIVLPELDAPTSTLTVDVNIQPFVNPVYGSCFTVGYLTDVNDFNTFHGLQWFYYYSELPWGQELRCKRVDLSGVPNNARIAFATLYEWFIQSVLVYETPEPFDVPYSISTFHYGQGENLGRNEGWIINNYSNYYDYFLSGTALLPVFNNASNTLQMDLSIKPYDSNSSNVQIGYVSGSNGSFTALQTFTNTSSWTDYMPKRISFSNAPSGARMAISCNGKWQINNVSVYDPSSTAYTLPYSHSFGATLPGGWLLNNYGYTSGTAYLTSGIAVLPQFQNYTSQTLIFDIAASPKDSNAQNIKIGYITNPNDASTFTEIETFYKTSSWTEFQPKRTLTSLPANARLAVQCNGDWNVRDVSVRIDPGTSLWPTQTAPYHLSTFGNNQPDGWLANNYVNNGIFRTGTSLLPNIHSAFTLNSFYIDIDVKPTTSNNNQTLNIGYVTTSSGQTTFHSLETIYSSSDWTNFRIKRLDYDGVPSGARMALSFGGEWEIRDVLVYPTPSPMAVPYSPTLGESQPQDWLANNYDNGCLKDGLAVLPRFDAEISTLLLDVAIMPKNTSATNIKIGYVTNPNDPSTFVATHTFINSSWNDYLPKRMQFVSAPTGARMAIQSNGDWNIAGVSVKATNSVQTVFDVPYNLPMTYTYPEGWIANNCSYTSNGFCFNSGTAVLPHFNATLSTLQMDIQLTPASGAQSIQIGYVTNPNNPSATFVALQTFNNSSTWNHPLKRVSFYGLNDNVRLAIKCNGTWMVSLLTVYIEPTPLDVPYYNSNNDGWIENISYHDYYMYPLYQSGCAILPRFNAPIGALQLQISFHTWDSDTHNLSIGYIINPNDLSTFTALQTHTASSTGNNWVNETISYFGVPTNARMAFVCEGTWAIGVAVTMPSISIPYTQGFEGMDVGSIPNGWYAPDMSVQGTYNSIAPHGGTKQLAGKGYIVLPVVENADYSALTLSLYARPEMTNYGGRLRVGYIPNGGALSQFVEIKNVTWNTNLSDYQQISASLAGIPTDARLTLYCFGYSSTANLWHLDDISIKPAETIPYTQPFATNSAPDGWSTYVGHYQESTHTANLTPNTDNSWHFGEANGVFDSHTYAKIGATSNDYKWLISPPIVLGDANGVNLSFDIAMSRESGNQVPLTPGEQENQKVLVLVTNDGGATWHQEMGWCGQMCGLPDLNVLNPDGNTYNHLLNNYQGQTIQVAFYAECTDNTDNCNHVHIDNVSIQSYDMTMPPTSVTVSEIAGHSAKISWTPALPVQYHWDLWLPYYDNPNYNNNCTPEYMQENGYYYQHLDGYYQHIVTGLEPNESYRAWVRYNDGTTTSDWVASDVFSTESMCAVPTNLQVEVTQHTALVTWDPGQSNQTSWYTHGGTDDMDGETVYEPFRLLTGLEPGEEYEISVTGYCEDGDGDSETISTTFTTLSLPTLTMNDGHSQDNFIVPITPYSLPDSESETQFIIPASQLIDMQYSDIRQISFYEGWYRNCAPWGADVWFAVRIMVVPEANYNNAQYPEDQFYGYNNNPDFETLYHGRLSLDNEGKMNISFGDHPFHYENGNLLIGVKQDTDDVGTDYQADWLGVQTQDWSSMYVPAGSDPTTAKFLPKVTFTYEPDDYLPPTDFEAYVTGAYEVTFSWTPRAGQTATEIMVCGSPDFVGNQFLTNSTDDHCTIVNPDFFEPEETYYYRYHGVYNVDGENHYSAWSAVGSFTMPDACEPPANLTVSDVGPFSAHFEWVSGADYVDLEYRERGEDQYHYTTVLSENFESSDLPLGWRTAQGPQTNGSGWTVFYQPSGTNSMAHAGRGCIASGCSSGIMNDYLIIPVNNLHGELVFWAKREGSESIPLRICISNSGYQIADFTQVNYVTPTNAYKKYTIDLTQYSGSGFIAIRSFSRTISSTVALIIDDLKFSVQTVVPTYGDWISAGSTEENQIDLYDLTPGTNYEARVRATCETGFSSEWSTSVSFSTPGNIVFEDPIVKLACVYAWDTNGDGELSYAEAAAVTDLSFVFNNDPTITSFNELQYFTGLTAISNDAFAGCISLSTITLPNTITSIDSYAFGSCSSLQSIVIPPSVTTIAGAAFNNCGLTEIDLPYSVTTIGTMAFSECNSLVSVYIPASVTTISNGNSNAFTGAALANIEVDAGNPVYDSRNGCNAIIETATNKLITGCQNTIIPYGVTSIGNSAFEDCSNLTDITLPATVETLGDYAFLNCTSLNTIEVNASTPPTMNTTEANHTFKNLDISNISVYVPCGSLETYQDSDWNGFVLFENCNIVFEDMLTKQICVEAWDRNYDGELSYREAAAVTSLNNEFYESNITSFNELQYFTGLDMIYEDDFVDCQQLVAVTLPPTVTTIDASAFTNCVSLASITFGENITDIGGYAFYGCTGLAFIKVEAQNPPTMGYNTFYGVPSSIPVYVPCGTKEEYEGDLDWSYFFNNFIDPCATEVQTIELVAGYNWVSTYIDGDPIELLEALQEALGDNGVSIEGPEGLNENLGDGFWWGDLDYVGIASGTMYLILVEDDCEVNLTGMPVDPSTVEITINPGYNWIGFPGMEEVEVEVALQGFEAEDGDAIEGPEGMTEYLGDGMWWGDFDMFVPGQGYMYNSASDEVKTLIFQTQGSKARVKAVSPNKTKNEEKPRPGLDDKQ